MNLSSDALTVVLAGGVGSRLSPLTTERAKPAVPFGGNYRIIDFTLSNCLHSGLRRVFVLTQYKSQSLQDHLRDAWSVYSPCLGEFMTSVPPQLRTSESWYCGTADAVYQNLRLLDACQARYILILSGDHVYPMNYSQMIAEHEATGADATIASTPVPMREASAFGILSVAEDNRVVRFEEKPDRPYAMPGNPDFTLASMGIYVFSKDYLLERLVADHRDSTSTHDFGKDVVPKMILERNVFGYRYSAPDGKPGYWRDVGTIDSYYQTSMDLLRENAPFDPDNPDWTIRSAGGSSCPAKLTRDEFGHPAAVTDSMVSNGTIVSGGTVDRSILASHVQVTSDAVVEDSILFDSVHVGRGCRLRNCIVDKNVVIPADETIGIHPALDAARFTISDNGIVVVPAGYRFKRSRVVPAPKSGKQYLNTASKIM